jgi:hypothetical protein
MGRYHRVRQWCWLSAIELVVLGCRSQLASALMQQPQTLSYYRGCAFQPECRRVTLKQLYGKIGIDASLHDHGLASERPSPTADPSRSAARTGRAASQAPG